MVYKRITKEQKAAWVAALRSGEYKQGKGGLHDIRDNSYCCLGVLCEVMGFSKHIDWGPYSEYEIPQTESSSYHDAEALGDTLLSDDEQETLMRMNDGRKHTFNTIADYIENNIQGV